VFQTNQDKRSLRSALLLGAASVSVVGLSVPASAQETTETVVVTGSRIPQTGLYSSSPVTAVGQQEMKFEGTTNVENLINNLPQAFGDFGSNNSNGATGTATVNLRNLGCARTLVLVDGKRLMPGDNSLPCADLNQIPASLVDHVEVVTGGASAVYGSDAVAGVVNFIMRRDFEGIEFDGQYSAYQHSNSNSEYRSTVAAGIFGQCQTTGACVTQAPGNVWDGDTVDGTIIMGVNSPNGKGNVTVYGGFRNIQPVLESQRDVSACAFSTTPPFTSSFCGGSSTAARTGALGTAGGRFISLDGGFCVDANGPHGSCTVDPNTGQMRAFTAADRFNFAPLNYFQRPDTRYTFGGFGHYEVDKALDFYGSIMFMDDTTVAQIAPSGLFFGTQVAVNCDNPFLGNPADPSSPAYQFCTSAGLGGGQDAHLFLGRRNVEGGNRQDHLEHAAYRMVFGFKGDVGGGWSYDVSGQYGKTILSEEYINDASISRIQNALEVVDVNGTPTCKAVLQGFDPTCVPWNVFQPNGVTQAATNYFSVPGFKEGGTEEWVLTGSVTGDLGQYGFQSPWAKNGVGIAVGAEYRQEAIEARVDNEFRTGDLAGQGGPTPNVNGRYNVREIFGEVRVPLVQNMPWVEDLSVNGGYRYSSYSIAGAVNSFKYGAEYQPIEDFRLRASYQRAIRAPNVLELFTPQFIGLWGGSDPCSGTTPQFTLQQCQRTGVTAAQYGTISDCPAAQCNALFGGNLNLRTEKSDTREIGGVFTPTFLDGFTLTVDYFNIRISRYITAVAPLNVVANCALYNGPDFCSAIHRGAGGVLFGLPPAGGFVDDITSNTGSLKTAGIDFEANYNTELSNWGMGDNGGLSFNFVGTWTDSFEITPFSQAVNDKNHIPPPFSGECAGLYGVNFCSASAGLAPNPEWKHKLRVTWSSPWDFDLSGQWRHISAVSLDANQPNPLFGGPYGDPIDATIDSFDYFDLSANWTVMPGFQLHAGVSNIADKDPPRLTSFAIGPPAGNGNTFPQTYDALGRYIFFGATVKY